jgi:hypothetical protein
LGDGTCVPASSLRQRGTSHFSVFHFVALTSAKKKNNEEEKFHSAEG